MTAVNLPLKFSSFIPKVSRSWRSSPHVRHQTLKLREFSQFPILITSPSVAHSVWYERLTVVAGRRNQTGGTQQRSKNRDRIERGVKFTRKHLLTPSLSPSTTSDGTAGETLRDDQAVGQVISAKANYMCVLVTKCLEPTPSTCQPVDGSLEDESSSVLHPGPSTRVGTELLCVVRALLKKLQQRVLVGDHVVVGAIDWTAGRGMIVDVLPRSTEIIDPPIANVDHVLLLFALQRPQLEMTSLSRFLVAAEATGVPLSLAFNKVDLVPPHVVSEWRIRLEAWGYRPFFCSVESEEGVGPLASLMQRHVSVVAGPSGVGKSSLINALRGDSGTARWHDKEGAGQREEGGESEEEGDHSSWQSSREGDARNPEAVGIGGREGGPGGSAEDSQDDARWQEGSGQAWEGEAEAGEGTWQMLRPGPASPPYLPIKVGPVSDRSGRGRHTTRHVTLLQLPGGGLLADTPGFSQPSLATISSRSLPLLFPEIQSRLQSHPPGCTFADCLHLAEPGCCVGSGWDRFRLYSLLMEELREREEAEKKSRGTKREGKMRLKVGAMGVVSGEPLLELKKHRRESRRTEHQNLEGDSWEEEREEEREVVRGEDLFGVGEIEEEEHAVQAREDVDTVEKLGEVEGKERSKGGTEEGEKEEEDVQRLGSAKKVKEMEDVRRFKRLLQSQR